MDRDEAWWMQEIILKRGDDLPRLEFADWLGEREATVTCWWCDGGRFERIANAAGDMDDEPCRKCAGRGFTSNGFAARAEFIRVQCEISGLQHQADYLSKADIGPRDPDWDRVHKPLKDLRGREQGLFDAYAAEWKLATGLTLPIEVMFRRGFVSKLTLSAEDWLRVHGAVYWHPGQTVACRECANSETPGLTRSGTWPHGLVVHDECKGVGHFPRPFVPTAQPLERVRLTNLTGDPDQFLIDNKFAVLNQTGQIGDGVWSSTKWPGLEFTMPDNEYGQSIEAYDVTRVIARPQTFGPGPEATSAND